MKWNKFFMLGVAGLALCACSNEDDLGSNGVEFPNGKGALSISIVNPTASTTKGIADKTTANTFVTGPIVVTLTDNGTERTISLTADEVSSIVSNGTTTETIKFWNVTNPTKVSVAMNGGQASYSAVSITDNGPVIMIDAGEGGTDVTHTRNMQSLAGIAAYGETSTFTPDGTDTPSTSDTNYEEGATSDDNGKYFEMYTATVQLEIPVARLEVSGITHIQSHIAQAGGTTNDCIFKTLTIDGVYMDNILANGDGVTEATKRVDYKYPTDNGTTSTATGIAAILSDATFGSPATAPSFLQNESWPTEDGKAYAYNFYAPNATQAATFTTDEQKMAINPQFKIYFGTAEGKESTENAGMASPRYAMITKYKTSEAAEEGIVLEAGKVYTITNAILDDENIIGTESGEDIYGVTVIVKEAEWKVVNTYADWAE